MGSEVFHGVEDATETEVYGRESVSDSEGNRDETPELEAAGLAVEHLDSLERAAQAVYKSLMANPHIYRYSLRHLPPPHRLNIARQIAAEVLQSLDPEVIMHLDEDFHLDEVMRYMQYDRGLAWSTIVNYSIDLKQFIRHLR